MPNQLANSKCIRCDTPSGPFMDPRFTMPHGYLGTYTCAECGFSEPLIDFLRRMDEELIREFLEDA